MRTLSYIMLILISIQVMMPCMDGICGQDEEIELTVSLDEHSHDREDESGHADHCSPFCTCSCCHSNYLSTGGNLALPIEFPEKDAVPRVAEPLSSFLDRIWQPPKA